MSHTHHKASSPETKTKQLVAVSDYRTGYMSGPVHKGCVTIALNHPAYTRVIPKEDYHGCGTVFAQRCVVCGRTPREWSGLE
jgi:hypothetical protein